MDNFEKIKENIKIEIEKEIHHIDSTIDINRCLDFFNQIIRFEYSEKTIYDLQGLSTKIEKTFSEVFIEKKYDNNILFDYCKTFEPFIKMLYHVLNEGNYILIEKKVDPNSLSAIGPYISAIDKVKQKYKDKQNKDVEEEFAYNNQISIIDGYNQYFAYSEKISLNKFDEYSEKEIFDYVSSNNKSIYLTYFILSYKYKNISSHQEPNLSITEANHRFRNTIICQLHLIHFFRRELSKSISLINFKKEDFDSYLNGIESKFNAKRAKYISLNLLEIRNDSNEPKVGLIEDILFNFSRIRILAQAGCGKTTTLEYLCYINALKFKEGKIKSFPVLVYLSNISKGQTLINLIASQINRSEEITKKLLEENRLQLFLDGLNEINTGFDDRKKKISDINEILNIYPSLSVIITDRFEFDSQQNNYFLELSTFEIVKLNDEQINSFINKYAINNDKKETAKEIIASKKNLSHLFEKPLFLSRALEIINDKNYLPDGEGQIIGQFIDVILLREKNEKADPLMNIKDFNYIFSFLANKIYTENNSINVPIHEIKVSKFLKEAADFFNIEHVQNTGYPGYLKRIGFELEIIVLNEDKVKFFHDNYFEYFHSKFMKLESIL